MISPYIRLADDFCPLQPLSLGPCWINDHALHYFKTGTGTYEIGGKHYMIEPNTVFLVPPGLQFSFRTMGETGMHMMNIHFDLAERSDSAAVTWPYPVGGERRDFQDEERSD